MTQTDCVLQEKAAEQRKKRKYRARQQRAYDRRRKFVRDTEVVGSSLEIKHPTNTN